MIEVYFGFALLCTNIIMTIAAVADLKDAREHRLKCSRWRTQYDVEAT